MKNKRFGRIGKHDVIKGAILAIITAVITVIYQLIQTGGHFPPSSADWNVIAGTGLSALLAYVLKNLGTNTDDKFMKREPKKPTMTIHTNEVDT